LILLQRRLFADARVNDRSGGGELRSRRPAAVLDAEDIERQGFSAGRDDAVLGDDAVLLATADEFAGEQNERALAAIDQDELVDGRAAESGMGRRWESRVRARPAAPCSLTMTSPLDRPSSSVRNALVSC
jgi:hypothetical protein